MSFRVCCPQCGAFCNVSDDYVGKAALCGNCDEPIIISKRSVSATNESPEPRLPEVLPRPVQSRSLSAESARALTNPSGEPTSSRRRWGCAIAIVASFIAILVAGSILTDKFRNSQHQVSCSSNLKQIGMGLSNYHDIYGSFPPPYIADKNGKPMHSWRVLILPFMEQQHLYDQYSFDEPWDGPNNKRLWSQMPNFYACPGADYDEPGLTSYQAIVGPNTAFEPHRLVSTSDITDGTSNTILVFEAASEPVHWMEPRDIQYDPMGPLPGTLWSSNHGDSVMWLRADVSTSRWKTEGLNDERLRSFIERSGRDPYRTFPEDY